MMSDIAVVKSILLQWNTSTRSTFDTKVVSLSALRKHETYSDFSSYSKYKLVVREEYVILVHFSFITVFTPDQKNKKQNKTKQNKTKQNKTNKQTKTNV